MRRTHAVTIALCVLLAPGLAACSSPAEAKGEPPSTVQTVPGSDVKQVSLSQAAATVTGIVTQPVAAGPAEGQLVVPYGAVMYYLDGTTWVYAETGERTYQREAITVVSIAGDLANLSSGPPAGTPVVTVGAPLLMGAELEIDGEQ